MHKHDFGQTLKKQSAVVTLSIRSRSLKSNYLFSVSKQCISASLLEKNPLVKRTEPRKRLILQYFNDGDLENVVTWKIRAMSTESYQLFILPL